MKKKETGGSPAQIADEIMDLVPAGLIPQDADIREKLLLAAKYLRSENTKLQRRLRRRDQQVRELALEKLLWGAAFSAETTAEMSEKYGLELDEGAFLLLLVRVPGLEATPVAVSKAKLTIRTALDEVLSENFKLNYTFIRGEDVVLASAGRWPGGAEEAFRVFCDLAREVCARIQKNSGLDPIICVSIPAYDAVTIRGAFQTLLDMREYSMSLPAGSRVITISDFPNYVPFDPDDKRFMAMSVEKQYINAVISHDFFLARQLTMDKIKHLIHDDINGLKTLKPFIESRLQATADLLMVNLSSVSVGGKNVQWDLDRIKEASDPEAIQDAVGSIFDKLDGFFNHSESELNGTAGKVIRFVSANYHNPSLSVEIICDEIGKSRSYLSRMFKDNTGMNLLDFLHTTRITEAKKLLTDTNLSVAEIGEKVGYYSGWTLARVFKRYEGITPSAYRDAYRKGGQAAGEIASDEPGEKGI